MSVEHLIESHEKLCQKARSIMHAKNHDYRGGSGDPFANFRGSTSFGIDPIVGILLRMQDKMQRIKTFAEKGQLQVKGEGVEDAIVDLINYSVLMYGLCQEKRASPGLEPDSPKSGDPIRPSVLAPLWDSSVKPATPYPESPYFLGERGTR